MDETIQEPIEEEKDNSEADDSNLSPSPIKNENSVQHHNQDIMKTRLNTEDYLISSFDSQGSSEMQPVPSDQDY